MKDHLHVVHGALDVKILHSLERVSVVIFCYISTVFTASWSVVSGRGGILTYTDA